MRYQAVLFDMDGTVLDTLADLTNAVNHILDEYAMPRRTPREVASFLGNGAARLLSKSVPAGTSDARLAEMLRVYQPWYDSHCAILTDPYPGILTLMKSLREAGVKQAVISNKQDSAVKRLAAEHFPGLLETAVGESRIPTPSSPRCERWTLRRRTPSMSAIPRLICRPPKTPALPAPLWAGAFGRRMNFAPRGRSAFFTPPKSWANGC